MFIRFLKRNLLCEYWCECLTRCTSPYDNKKKHANNFRTERVRLDHCQNKGLFLYQLSIFDKIRFYSNSPISHGNNRLPGFKKLWFELMTDLSDWYPNCSMVQNDMLLHFKFDCLGRLHHQMHNNNFLGFGLLFELKNTTNIQARCQSNKFLRKNIKTNYS